MCDWASQHYKRWSPNNSSSGVDGKVRAVVIFDVIDPSLNPPYAKLFSLPLQISYLIGKAFIFNKNERNNRKVENKVLGMVGVGVSIEGFIVKVASV